MSLFGPPNPEKMKAKNDIAGLIKALSYQKDDSVCKAAASILGELKEPRAVEPLMAMLDSPVKSVYADAVRALGAIGDTRAVRPFLVALVRETSASRPTLTNGLSLHAVVMDTLEKMGVPAVEQLIVLLKSKEQENAIRNEAAKALGQMKESRATEALLAALSDRNVSPEAASALGAIKDASTVEPLLSLFQSGDNNTRELVAGILGEIGDPRAVDPLIARLGDIQNNKRTRIAKMVSDILIKISKPSVVPLIAALKHENWIVRWDAARTLGALGDARAVEPLGLATKDADCDVRRAAVLGLGKIGAPAVDALLIAAKGDDPETRHDAIDALGDTRDARAIEPLVALLNDADTTVCKSAAMALEKLGWQPGNDEKGVSYWIAKQDFEKCAALGSMAVEPLIGVLRNPAYRNAAARALDKIGWKPTEDENSVGYWFAKRDYDKCVVLGSHAVDVLISGLSESDKDIRWKSARALGEIGDKRAVMPLIMAINKISGEGGSALAKIGDPSAVDALIARLKDNDEDVRKNVADALGNVGNAQVVEPLIAMLKDGNAEVRENTAKALGRIQDVRALEPLVAMLKDSNEDVRKSAIDALGQIGDPRVVEPLLEALKDSSKYVRLYAASALGKTRDVRAVEPLIAALQNGTEYYTVRSNAASSLGSIGDIRALEPLLAALGDADKYVRSSAVSALGTINKERAVEPLLGALKDAEADVRRAAICQLGDLADLRAVEPLIGMLQDTDKYNKVHAARALGKLGDSRAIEPLKDILNQKNTDATLKKVILEEAFPKLGENQ